jgi:hypothetical protein
MDSIVFQDSKLSNVLYLSLTMWEKSININQESVGSDFSTNMMWEKTMCGSECKNLYRCELFMSTMNKFFLPNTFKWLIVNFMFSCGLAM